jgi:cardiolipin synthase
VGYRKTAQAARLRHRDREANHSIRFLADQAFSRTAGAPLIPGNSVRILKDAAENYPAWLAAIESAERTIHFESYIIHEDDLGQQFAEALMAKARAGVRVRLIYDWLGAISATSRRFWRHLRQAGVEVRCFNPPHIDSPFGWLSRDHRKMISVDGKVGFVTGLCVGRRWVGYPEQNIDPWRDTGVEVRGPAVADIERAFAQIWSEMGPAIPEEELPRDIPAVGNVMLRVIASMPNTAGLYRLDQLIAAGARKSLWLTDAYFVGTTPYVQAVCAAAKDGVDVRLLVPQASDIMLIRSLSRAGYRPLLEAGVRVFEWNGPMLHAKTAVADGRWARVGSSNLNLASWIGNYELDVSVEDEGFAKEMMEMYEDDLENATEIVLNEQNRVRSTRRPGPRRSRRKIGQGSTTRAAAGAIRLGNTVGAAITNHRVLGPAEAQIMITGGLLLLVLSILSVIWPLLLTIPFAAVGIWFALSLLFRAYALHASGRKETMEVAAKTVTKPEAISGTVDEGSKHH